MRPLTLLILLLGLCAGCTKTQEQGKAPEAPTKRRWAEAAKDYNGPSGTELAKHVVVPVAVKTAPKAPPTDELLNERRTALSKAALDIANEMKNHFATGQLAELAATATTKEALAQVTTAAPAEESYTAETNEQLKTLAKDMQAWSLLATPGVGGKPRDLDQLRPTLVAAVQALGPAAIAYQQETTTFAQFLGRHWEEFWVSEGQRMLRRNGFEAAYKEAGKKLIEARRKFERAAQQVEAQSRAR